MNKSLRISTVTRGLCLGIGLASALSFIPAYAASSNQDYSAEAAKSYSAEELAKMKAEADEQFKDVKYDAAIVEGKDSIPADGDKTNLNVGWSNKQGHIYYCKDESRVKVTGWQKIDSKWYFFDSTTYEMQTGWLKVNGVWYYFKSYSDCEDGKANVKNGLGAMQTGWINDNGTWYYLNNDGAMKSNSWIQDGGSWYYVTGSGAMATNTTINGYTLGPSGAWVK